MVGVEKKRSGYHDKVVLVPSDYEGQDLRVNPVLVAVTRLGGSQACADHLVLPRATVANWVKPSRLDRPSNTQIRALGNAAGISPACIFAYYETLKRYRPTMRAYWKYRQELNQTED